MSAKTCSGCHQPIEGKWLGVGGQDFLHPACFVCCTCKTSLASGKPSTRRPEGFVCADCVGGDRCHRCTKQIGLGQKGTKVAELAFHETCLTCAQVGCGAPIPKDKLYLSQKNVKRDIYCAHHTYV